MQRKENIKKLLENKEFEDIVRLAESNKSVIRNLFSFLYSTDDLLHWRAAEALGIVAGSQSDSNIDGGRNIPRRLVWSLAEESGATAWPAPEALGAVVAARPSSFLDFGRIVLSFIDDPVLCRGVLWSARKISEKRADLTREIVPKVIELLKDPDATIRGHAAWALGAMQDKDAIKKLTELQTDTNPLFIYNAGELKNVTVGELAAASIAELKKLY